MQSEARTLRVSTLLGTGAAALLFACGGGGSGTPPAPTTSGTLAVTGCVIAEGASSCQATISWTSTNAAAPRVMLGSSTLATTASGTLAIAVGASGPAVGLFDGGTRLDEKPVGATCAAASAWDGARCLAFAQRSVDRAPTPFVENGQAVTLEVVLYKPFGPGPFPAVVFHHGSTGNGDDPTLFRLTYTNEGVARFFTERGWLVAFPQRRGRGQSDGLYDEGFTPTRSAYSCLQGLALAGLERALLDADAAVTYLRGRGDIVASRLLAAGFSRGGILAAAQAARRPGVFVGVINFVGGWIGEGCTDAIVVNRSTFAAASAFSGPMIWLYGENDPFYSVAHSRANFDAFAAAGGTGAFRLYARAPGLSGHLVINDPALWTPDLDAYVKAR